MITWARTGADGKEIDTNESEVYDEWVAGGH